MKNKVKKYAKGMVGIAGTGIGVGLAGVAASELGAEEVGGALGKASKILTPAAAGIYTAKFAMDTLSESARKRKHKKR